jgi:hypothetical protein
MTETPGSRIAAQINNLGKLGFGTLTAGNENVGVPNHVFWDYV